MSKSVNNKANEVWFNHNCGCCPDSPLQAWPHIIHKETGTKIHSNPACFMVGEQVAFGIGEQPYDNWQEKLKKENISSTVIKKIKEFFKENKPRHYELEND